MGKKILFKTAEFAAKKMLIFIERIKNRAFYNRGKISRIEYELKKFYLKNVRRYSSINFYQSYPPLVIRGARPTLSRYLIYGLDDYLNKKQRVLDIGGNTGFFSLFISSKVKEVDVLEIDKAFCEVCKRLAKHEKIKNVNVLNKDFNTFNPKEKYDVILSFAVHKHTKMDFKDYMDKVFSMLSKDGFVLIESHPIGYKGKDKLESKIKKLEYCKIFKKGKLDDDGRLRTFFYLKRK